MSNMSYCRWENTSKDLMDCVEDFGEFVEDGGTLDEYLEKLSSSERRAFNKIINECNLFMSLYEDSE